MELPHSFRQLRTRLLKRPGGDREMVDILALMLLHDEPQVERAVAKALDAGEPSKQHLLAREWLVLMEWRVWPRYWRSQQSIMAASS